MIPSVPTSRMRLLFASAMRILPSGLITAALGALSCAIVAGPSSPAEPVPAPPATVTIVPSASTRLIRSLPWSTMR
jgi:hypothetical protein